MLVLSRRMNEKIVFPTREITIQVVGIKGGAVRLGIQAPDGIPVVREEILHQDDGRIKQMLADAHQREHALRNRLNAATVGLALLHRQLAKGLYDQMGNTLDRVSGEVAALRQDFEKPDPPVPEKPLARPVHLTALLVEDDANECELLAGFLRMAGFDVATAGDGADALGFLEHNHRPDVMVLDMMLPRCDGKQIVQTVRRDPTLNPMKIIAVSGHTPEQLDPSGAMSGIDRWFRKPLNPEALLRELATQLKPLAT